MKHKPFICALSAIFLMLPCITCITACSPDNVPPALETPPVSEEPLEQERVQPTLPEEVPEETEPNEVVTIPNDPVPEPEPEPEPEPKTVEYILAKTAVNIRSGAGTSYSSRGQTQASTLYGYSDKTGEWYKSYYQNRVCYISANSSYTQIVSFPAASDSVEKIIAEGVKLLGTPYVYGAVRYHSGNGTKLSGFSVTAFDCSSLMQYIFYMGNGTLLNVTTRTQISQGVKVNKSDIQRGDLLFFTNASRYNNTGIERVGHVALYLGNNYILHTASDFAKIEQISATRWSYFLEARRIVE